MEQFAKIPHKMIEQFSGTELKIYGAIDLHCHGNKNSCWPGGEKITRYTGIKSRTTISNAKQKLIEGSRLESFERKGTSNLYKLKRPKKQFVAVTWPALLLSGGAFKLYLYLKKSCIENITTIPTAKIKKDCGISDSITLFTYLVELQNDGFFEVEDLTPEGPVKQWCIEKAHEKVDKDTPKSGQTGTNNWTGQNKEARIIGHPHPNNWTSTHEKLDMKQTIRIRLFETDYIMQNKKDFQTEKQKNKGKQKNKKKFITDEQKTEFPAEDLKQKISPQKNENTDFRPLNNKQRRKIRKREGKFSKQEWAILLDQYDRLKEKAVVDEYVNHEWKLYDADPMDKKREAETRKFLICEFLSKQGRQIPERYKTMTPEQKQAEIDNDPVVQNKLYYIENHAPPEDETNLLALYRNQFKPVYEKQI